MPNLNKLFPRLPIQTKLAIGFSVVALVPLTAVTAVGVRHTVGVIRRAAGATLARDLELAETHTAQNLAAAQGHVDFFARVLLGNAFGGRAPELGQLRAVSEEIARHVAVEPTLWRVHVYSPEGDVLLSVDRRGPLPPARSEEGGGAAPYYAWRAQEVPNGQQVILPVEVRHSSSEGRETTVAALAIVRPIYGEGDELRGVIVGETLAASVFAGIESASAGYEGVTALVDTNGFFLYHSARKREWARLLAVRHNETLRTDYTDDLARLMLSGAVGERESSSGELVSFRPLRLAGWANETLTIYRAVPVDRLQAPVRAFVSRVAVLGFVAVALVLLAALLAANQFTRPIIRMRAATARIARQEEADLAPVETNDELEDLAHDLSGMARTIAGQRRELQGLLSEQGRVLARTRAALADVVDHSADAIITTTDEGRVTVWNRGATRLFGYTPEEAFGQSLEDLIGRHGAGVEREQAYLARELELHGEVVNYTTERADRLGNVVPVSLTLTRIDAPEGGDNAHSLILRDNRQHAQLDEQLRRSERLAAVSVLAAGLAHEINTPLAILGNRIEVMQRELERAVHPSRLRSDLEVLASHVSRLAAVTSGLLRFAREDDGNESELHVGDVARRVAGLLERTIVQRRLRFDVDVGDELPRVRANERAIETVVVNLLLNAADATPPGGTVSLVVAPLGDGDGVRLSVSDTGPGVPIALRERVFEPFFTTKPPGQGTGLGLTVCRTIVERHGGLFVLTESPDGGAEFGVTLYRNPVRFTWMSRAS